MFDVTMTVVQNMQIKPEIGLPFANPLFIPHPRTVIEYLQDPLFIEMLSVIISNQLIMSSCIEVLMKIHRNSDSGA